MWMRFVAAMLIGSVCAAQTPLPQAAAAQAAGASGSGETVTVARGTVVPLTLVNPIKSKSSKVGDTVRAVVAFPVTSGTQMAVPAGTYVEGVIVSLTPQMKKTRQPDVQIRFTRLLYANGYTVALDAANTASAVVPTAGKESAKRVEVADSRPKGPAGLDGFEDGPNQGFMAQTTSTVPTLPPLPGPSYGIIFGVIGGVLTLIITSAIFFGHRAGTQDYVLFNAGWQLQMTLGSDLAVDGSRVNADAR